jgi:hypothetical protein
VPKTSLHFAPSLLILSCLGALLAIGCGNAGSGLADAARNISHRTSRLEGAGTPDAGDEEMQAADDVSDDMADDQADDMAAADAPAEELDETADAESSNAIPTDAPVVDAANPPPRHSDDAPRCGDGNLDADELCDVSIEAGRPGACPTECEPLDACHAAALLLDTCWSQCALGAPVPCS